MGIWLANVLQITRVHQNLSYRVSAIYLCTMRDEILLLWQWVLYRYCMWYTLISAHLQTVYLYFLGKFPTTVNNIHSSLFVLSRPHVVKITLLNPRKKSML